MNFDEACNLIITISKECNDFRSLNIEKINDNITCIELKIRRNGD